MEMITDVVTFHGNVLLMLDAIGVKLLVLR